MKTRAVRPESSVFGCIRAIPLRQPDPHERSAARPLRGAVLACAVLLTGLFAVGNRLTGTPRFGIGTSGGGRDYRLGYGLTLVESGAMHFEVGLDAHRLENLGQGTAEHGVLGRLTARW